MKAKQAFPSIINHESKTRPWYTMGNIMGQLGSTSMQVASLTDLVLLSTTNEINNNNNRLPKVEALSHPFFINGDDDDPKKVFVLVSIRSNRDYYEQQQDQDQDQNEENRVSHAILSMDLIINNNNNNNDNSNNNNNNNDNDNDNDNDNNNNNNNNNMDNAETNEQKEEEEEEHVSFGNPSLTPLLVPNNEHHFRILDYHWIPHFQNTTTTTTNNNNNHDHVLFLIVESERAHDGNLLQCWSLHGMLLWSLRGGVDIADDVTWVDGFIKLTHHRNCDDENNNLIVIGTTGENQNERPCILSVPLLIEQQQQQHSEIIEEENNHNINLKDHNHSHDNNNNIQNSWIMPGPWTRVNEIEQLLEPWFSRSDNNCIIHLCMASSSSSSSTTQWICFTDSRYNDEEQQSIFHVICLRQDDNNNNDNEGRRQWRVDKTYQGIGFAEQLWVNGNDDVWLTHRNDDDIEPILSRIMPNNNEENSSSSLILHRVEMDALLEDEDNDENYMHMLRLSWC